MSDMDIVYWSFGAVAAFLVLLIFIVSRENKNRKAEYDRLLKQCMADGKKEYECVAMLKHVKDGPPMPTIMPTPIIINQS